MARKIYITGDAQGFAEIKDDEDIIIDVSVKHALIANLAKEVSVVSYAETSGSSTDAVAAQIAERCSGNSKTATQLKEERKISLNGDIDAEFNFDGSADVAVDVKVKKSDNDGYGNNIYETYLKKNDLMISEYNGKPSLIFTRNGRLYRFIGEEV